MGTGRETVSVNPATGEVIGRRPEDSVEDVRNAVAISREAQKEWGKKSFIERGKHLLLIRDHVVRNADRLAETISRDSGKTRTDALTTEVIPAAMSADYYARHGGRALGRKAVFPGNIAFANKRSYVDRVPLGVVGIITPWNYPFGIPFHEIMMGLIAGNGVVLKVATQSQEVGKVLEECINAGGLPAGLFAHVNLPGWTAGEAFIEGGIQKLFFTGSGPAGKKLMAKAAERLLPVSLELGGNDAMIVCHDANIRRAVRGALWAGYSNAGQSCAGVERIYVEAPVYAEFVGYLRSSVEKLTQGVGTGFDVQVGSLTTEKQLRTVTEHVNDAVEKGGVITAVSQNAGGSPGGYFYPPTVLEQVNDSMLTLQQETFGPVVAVMRVESIDEAVERANNSNLGLTASVWTGDRKKAHAIAGRLEVGTVTINDHLMSHGLPGTPWGGFKESGLGRTHGQIGLEQMTQPRVVIDDLLPGVQKNMWWYPHTPEVYGGMLGLLHFLYGGSLVLRIRGGMRLARTFLRTFRDD